MGKRKYTFYAFHENETAAFARYLEEMAEKGWMLKRIMAYSIQCFEWQKPRRIKVSVVILPGSSEFESKDNEGARTFREYCEEAGWHLVYGGTLWQIFYSEEEAPVPIETDRKLQLEAQKQVMLSPGKCLGALVIAGLFLFDLYMMLKEPGRAFAMDNTLLMALITLYLAAMFPAMLLWRLVRFRKAERMLEQTGQLPTASLTWVKRRNVLTYAAFFLFLFLLQYGSGQPAGLVAVSLLRALLLLAICLMVLTWVREHGQGDRRENAIGYFVGAVTIGTLVTTIVMHPLETLVREEPPEEVYQRLEEFPVTFEELGFEADPDWHRESCRTWLSFYQVESGKKKEENGKETHLHMTYYKSPVPLIISGTRWYYPRDKGNVWKIQKTERRRENGILVTRYRYTWEHGEPWGEENAVQDTYVLSDRNRLLALSFTAEVGEGEMEGVVEEFGAGDDGAL